MNFYNFFLGQESVFIHFQISKIFLSAHLKSFFLIFIYIYIYIYGVGGLTFFFLELKFICTDINQLVMGEGEFFYPPFSIII